MARMRAPIKKDIYIKVIFKLPIHRLNGRLMKIVIVITLGPVNPMLATNFGIRQYYSL